MNLRHQGHVAMVETCDDMEFPQGPTAIQGPAHNAADQGGQLVRAAGPRDAGSTHVEVDVEIGVVHHCRVLETERHLGYPGSERWHPRHPSGYQVADLVEPDTTGYPRRVEHQHPGDVEVGGR